MEIEKDSFIKYFSENRNEYNDPKMKQENEVITLKNNGIDGINLVGNIFIVLLAPLVIILLISNKKIPTSINSFSIGFSIVWVVVTLYKRIQKIKANNNVLFDLENKIVTIEPQDYFRKNIIKKKKQSYSFDSIRSIKTKKRNYDKFNSGLRLILNHKNEEITLVDIWSKKLGNELLQFIQKLINRK